MSNTVQLAFQMTGISLVEAGARRVRASIDSLGPSAQGVKRDFEQMERSVSRGLKALALTAYAVKQALPGVKASGDLQEAMLRVKGNLAGGAKEAGVLARELAEVKRSAIEISANAPFSAEDVVNIENALLKAGMALPDVTGKAGAAFAATALASLTGSAPELIGDSLARIGSQFDLKGGQYGELADWIVKVDDASATSVPELIQGLRMAGSNAQALGISAKDSITTLGALAPLGERAGSSFNNMLIGMVGVNSEQKKMLAAAKLSFFDKGKFIGLDQATALLRKRFGGMKDDQQRLTVLTKIFGEEGARAANTLIGSAKGFSEIEQAAKTALGLQDKMAIWAEGFNASMKKLGGTTRSTLASLFDPMLATLTKISNLANTVVGKIGAIAEEYKGVTTAVNAVGASAVVAGGGYALWQLAKGGLAGSRVLKGLGGLKGVLGTVTGAASGIAAGKAVEAATGVAPVFVTNWPNGFGGGAGAPGAADIATSAGWLGRFTGLAKGALAAESMTALAGMGAGTIAAAAALVLGTGAAAYGAGTLANDYLIEGTAVGDAIGEQLNRLFAFFGNEESKRAIEINMAIDAQGRVVATSNDMTTKVNPTLNRGNF
jgi:TP901 family phage tail tape measure protein